MFDVTEKLYKVIKKTNILSNGILLKIVLFSTCYFSRLNGQPIQQTHGRFFVGMFP